MEDDIDVFERRTHGFIVLHLALAELRRRVHPGGLALLVRVRFQVVQDADRPALADQQVCQVRSNEPGTAGKKSALLMVSHVLPSYRRQLSVTVSLPL